MSVDDQLLGDDLYDEYPSMVSSLRGCLSLAGLLALGVAAIGLAAFNVLRAVLPY